MVLHLGMADCAQEDTVKVSQLFQTVRRHHATGFEVGLAAPIEVEPGEVNAIATACCFEHPDAFGDDFAPDSIARDDRDLVLLFGVLFHRILAYFPQSATSFRASSTRSKVRTRLTIVSAFSLGHLANAALPRNFSATSS